MFFTDDPVRDAQRYYEEKEQELERLPKCADCGEPIQDEYCVEIGEGKYICEHCLEERRVRVDSLTD